MASHSGRKRAAQQTAAIKEMASRVRRAIDGREDTFIGPPAPPRPAPKTGSFGSALAYFLGTADEVHRMRASLEAARLQSDTARAMSRKKWLSHFVRKAQALEHVANGNFPSRTAAAWEIVDFLQHQFGQSVSWKAAYMWLPAVAPRRSRLHAARTRPEGAVG